MNPANEGVDLGVDASAGQPAAPLGFADRSQLESAALRVIDANATRMSPKAQSRLDAVIRDTATDPMGLGAAYIRAVADPAYETGWWKVVTDPTNAAWRMSPAEHRAMQNVQQVESLRAMRSRVRRAVSRSRSRSTRRS